MPNQYLITIVGPTAIGKSALAVVLAKELKTEIISADSRQFYRELRIGTAVPTLEEQGGITHHFLQHKSIHDTYTVGDFETDALEKLALLFKKYSVVVMAGGSGLYNDAVLYGLDSFPAIDSAIRMQLNNLLQEEGIASLQARLQQADPVYFKQVDTQNPRRLLRALEVITATGKPYSSFLQKKKAPRQFIPIIIGLTAPREIIYQRINERVENMMEQGLLSEAREYYPYRHLNALQTVGYKELFCYLEGSCTLEEAILDIKKNTRRYAKRQLTWFRRNPATWWVHYDTQPKTILREIIARMT